MISATAVASNQDPVAKFRRLFRSKSWQQDADVSTEEILVEFTVLVERDEDGLL